MKCHPHLPEDHQHLYRGEDVDEARLRESALLLPDQIRSRPTFVKVHPRVPPGIVLVVIDGGATNG